MFNGVIKQHIERLIHIALKQLQESDELLAIPAFIQVEATKIKQHGDLASNIAIILSQLMRQPSHLIAKRIIECLPESSYIYKVEIAGPGFINFFLSPQAFHDVIEKVLTEKETYGRHKMGRGKRILIEFLSAHPIGPLHAKHGRHAAFGAVMANLLEAVGFKAYREYDMNDIGQQVDILAVSIWLRYLHLCGETLPFPKYAYQGHYIIEMAQAMYAQYHLNFHVKAAHLEAVLNDINQVISKAQKLLGDKYDSLVEWGLKSNIADIREDLTEWGIYYDNWFSERQFETTEMFEEWAKKLKENRYVYEQEGEVWFRATHFGDKNDLILIHKNGQYTSFARDIIYHLNKFDRGFDIVMDVFGSNHDNYIRRIKAAMSALDVNPERLIILLMQGVRMPKENKAHSSSFTLRELRNRMGQDATRFFYMMYPLTHSINLNEEMIKRKSAAVPLYYVQYAYARICSIFRQLALRNQSFNEKSSMAYLHLLTQPAERQLCNTIAHYPDMIVTAALHYKPHLLPHYLNKLAADFHTYYHTSLFLVEDTPQREARLALIMATQQVLLNGLNLLGITALDNM